MTNTSAALAILIGLAMRLALPIALTAVAVLVLSRLDRRWQGEATLMAAMVTKPQCWKTQHCSPAKRRDCPGFRSKQPCWQVFRQNNGYLDQKCLECPVLAAAAVPTRA
jgi:hypothetical protein